MDVTAPEKIASVDLGSNSFHMIVARVSHGQIEILDRLRDRVQIAAGLNDQQCLTEAAQKRALDCLERFGQLLRPFSADAVRAVGTNTLRQANNSDEFLQRARNALGHNIEVISGREEARLIYLGAAHSIADVDPSGRRLVVDVGGGSTELVIGERFDPITADSIYIGCVSYSLKYFPGGKIDREAWRRAEIAAGRELQTIDERYRQIGWRHCVGCSGTILAVAQVLRVMGLAERGISAKALKKLRKTMITAGHVNQLQWPDVPADRLNVLPGGTAILCAIFDHLGIEQLDTSNGALREGLLYDLLGRIQHEDVRDVTIRRLADRYLIDQQQASRVEKTVLTFYDLVANDWELAHPIFRQYLSWAARLHEIGLSIAYDGYHKHGAYLMAHADMPGFSRDDQNWLSALIHNHRRKFQQPWFRNLPPSHARLVMRMCILLRLAVCLNRSRSTASLPTMALSAKRDGLHLNFPENWLADHPLTLADLDEESARLREIKFRLVVR